MKHSYPTSEALKFLLQMAHNREMALPDFQRDFVWDPSATNELIESIISNYPAGSLLRIKNGSQLLFQPRAIEEAPALGKAAKPSYLILDGQQRLTSLYQAFYGVGEHKYYLNLSALEGGKDLEDCLFYLRTDDGDGKYGTIAQQAASLVFPLGKVFADGGFSGWTTKVLKERCSDMAEMLDLQTRFATLYERWVRPVEEYEFPMVTLNEDTAGAAVCTIFETLNRTGVKLSVFDLLTARFWAQDLNLRELWEDARNDFSIIEDFDIDPYYTLQIIGLLEPGVDKDAKPRAPSIKRSAILEMSVLQARQGWKQAVEGLAAILAILRDECGVLVPTLLPYTTILIPMAATWASQGNVKGADEGANRIKLIRWFWCSIFGQQYENSANSQAEKDFGELRAWMQGGPEPESVQTFRPDSVQLRTIRPKQRAAYRGTMALILQNGALDFHKRGPITAQLVSDKKNPVDDHHIFPRAFLNEQNTSPALRDCILNRTYIDRTTNRRLSKRAPSDYFSEILQKHGVQETDKLFGSHLLPDGAASPLLSDDFEGFLTYREKLVMQLVQEKTAA